MMRLLGLGKQLRRSMLSVTMWKGVLLEEEEGGEGEKWVGWSAKALVGFGLWFGGDGQPPQNLSNVMPMMQWRWMFV